MSRESRTGYPRAVRRSLLLSVLVAAPLGCRGEFDLDKYLIAEGESESGSESAGSSDSAGSESAGSSDSTGESESTSESDSTSSESDSTTDVVCETDEFDLGSVCVTVEAIVELDEPPTDFELADFNNDGLIDVIVAGSQVRMFTNLGGTTFGPADPITGASGPALASADIDADGRDDLAVFRDNSIDLFVANNNGFAPETTLSLGGFDGLFTNLDGDSDPDLVVSGSSLKVLIFEGGVMLDVEHPVVGQDLAVLTLDGDLNPSVVMTMPSTSAIAIAENTGTTLGLPVEFDLGVSATDVAVVDVDGDGTDDILVTTTEGNLRIYDPAFNLLDLIPVGVMPTAIALGDLDGDGTDDLAIADGMGNQVLVMIRDPIGGLGPLVELHTDDPLDFPEAIAIADLDGDGLGEIVVGMLDTNRLVVFG